jgi:glycine/serine hydroxymethyltransferase
MKEEDMAAIAEVVSEVYKRGARDAARKKVQKIARSFAH